MYNKVFDNVKPSKNKMTLNFTQTYGTEKTLHKSKTIFLEEEHIDELIKDLLNENN